MSCFFSIDVKFVDKYGVDNTTGLSKHNQIFETAVYGEIIDDSRIMVSGMVPLLLEFEGQPIWINKDVNSKLAFRPKRLSYEVSFPNLQIQF